MNVKELIKQLQEFPEDYEVHFGEEMLSANFVYLDALYPEDNFSYDPCQYVVMIDNK